MNVCKLFILYKWQNIYTVIKGECKQQQQDGDDVVGVFISKVQDHLSSSTHLVQQFDPRWTWVLSNVTMSWQ